MQFATFIPHHLQDVLKWMVFYKEIKWFLPAN